MSRTGEVEALRELLRDVLRFAKRLEDHPDESVPLSVGLTGAHLRDWQALSRRIRRALQREDAPN